MATKDDVATLFERIANLLEAIEDNPFRIQSYRDGAQSIRETTQPVIEMAQASDIDALKNLPDIGEGLARIMVEFVHTGHSTLLQDLEERVTPVDIVQQIPGLGPKLAQRIVHELDIQTLEELEQAAHDGRLENLPGFGPRRIQSIRDSLEATLRARTGRRAAQRTTSAVDRPSVATLLQVDSQYRRRAAAGQLRRIAPRRFNPEGEAWLPIMHSERDGWRFTALFSNTARAHELQKTDDWVVIYYEKADGKGEERQNTVVTETSGPLEGKRVVRGRAAETADHYKQRNN